MDEDRTCEAAIELIRQIREYDRREDRFEMGLAEAIEALLSFARNLK